MLKTFVLIIESNKEVYPESIVIGEIYGQYLLINGGKNFRILFLLSTIVMSVIHVKILLMIEINFLIFLTNNVLIYFEIRKNFSVSSTLSNYLV